MVRLIEEIDNGNQSVKDWYYDNFRRKLNIPDDLTFEEVINELYYGSSIYRATRIHNKEVCSNLMYAIANILGITYDEAMCYFIWHDAPNDFIPSNVNYQRYVDIFNRYMEDVLDKYMQSR